MKKKKGFAAMDRDTHRLIASFGGRVAHRKGVAHQWSSEKARIAGEKGRKKRKEMGKNG